MLLLSVRRRVASSLEWEISPYSILDRNRESERERDVGCLRDCKEQPPLFFLLLLPIEMTGWQPPSHSDSRHSSYSINGDCSQPFFV